MSGEARRIALCFGDSGEPLIANDLAGESGTPTEHRFTGATGAHYRITGTFNATGEVTGTLRVLRRTDPYGMCDSGTVRWQARRNP